MNRNDLLVGSTGFVGGNLISSHQFTHVCHSSDINNYFGSNPDLCVYAGVPAAMFLANSNPNADLEIMKEARENIRKINPKKLVLISSIAVYKDSRCKDENSLMETDNLPAYGKNRLQLEQWVREDYPEALIVRLPALYGKGLKKNFLFDLHTIAPSMLNKLKYEELVSKTELVKNGYSLQDNGFYCLNGNVNKEELKSFFKANDFNALSFTDSRSKYQFYNLSRLWNDINKALDCGITMLNLCTPPVTAKEVYEYVTGDTSWTNELDKEPYDYDLHSIFSDKLGGNRYYLCSIEEELKDIKQFMHAWGIDMKLSISNIAWDIKDNDKVFQLMKKYGYSGLEIAPTKIVADNPYEHIYEAKLFVDCLYKGYGINVSSMQSIWYGRGEKIFGSEEERKALIEYTRKAIDYASAIGCHNLVFGCPRNRNTNSESDYAVAVSFFKELGDYAYSKNTCIGMEANPPIYNTNFINDTKSAIKLIEDVDSKGFLLNLDVGTMIYNQENIDALRDKAHLINHVHISEPHLKMIVNRDLHSELNNVLVASNYSGYVSIEMSMTDDMCLLENAMKYVSEVF